jgi:acetyl-CoA C-acetyltransferase
MFRTVSATDLATVVVKTVVERAGISAQNVGDVILGQGYSSGEAPALGRVATPDAGLDATAPYPVFSSTVAVGRG